MKTLTTNGPDNIPLGSSAQINVKLGTVITCTPVVDTSALTAGDTIFDTTVLSGAVLLPGGTCVLESVTLLDKADQTAAAITLLFFDAAVTFGVINAAPSIIDADMLHCLGAVAFAAGDFVDVGASKIGTKLNVGLMLKATVSSKNLWVAGFAAGTPTEGAATDIVIKLGFSNK